VARAARRAGTEVRSPVSAVNLGTIRALVSAGLGVAVLPQVALHLPGPALHGVRLTSPPLVRVVALARNTARYESPAARVFTEFLRSRLRPQ
jgi:LysR family transcriptional activator of glutamate synthase operon